MLEQKLYAKSKLAGEKSSVTRFGYMHPTTIYGQRESRHTYRVLLTKYIYQEFYPKFRGHWKQTKNVGEELSSYDNQQVHNARCSQ